MSRLKTEVYLLTTADKYELPVGVYDSVPDMARALGRDHRTLHSNVSRALRSNGRIGLRVNGQTFRVYKIDVGGDED